MAEDHVHVVLGEEHADALRDAAMAAVRSISAARSRGAMPAVGSSMRRSLGWPASATASSTRFTSP